ncbi:helicase SNF2 [Niabella ginsenosidivorans]|uniref:Helicase SNF2 n=1 Tax=Niabella ginsenosidivorans TaxID=1176587 RepID=A0A1A9HX59_9BACT|nr:DEAD/DEAH box helicase [Niabella ginsenosidivorans]ANH79966.1 helicase SNF2 [Niabella ginsenosidivorans]
MATQRITALLINPQKANEKTDLLKILTVNKNGSIPLYETTGITGKSLNDSFKGIPKEAAKLAAAFGEAAVFKTVAALKGYFDRQQLSLPYRTFLQQELIKYHHDCFRQLKPWFQFFKWYHSRKGANDRWVTAPCQLHKIPPHLKFEVTGSDGAYNIVTIIEIDGIDYPATRFVQDHFFLEKEQHYYLLSLSDYRTLQWLQHLPPDQPFEEILQRLEERYTVIHSTAVERKLITTVPVPGVLLSELNETFLMLTPQWNYDGYVIDGPWQEQTELQQKGQTIIISRDKDRENELKTLLETLHPRFREQRNGYYYLSFAEAQKRQWFSKVYHRLLISDIELKGMDLLKHFRYSPHLPATELEKTAEDGHTCTYYFTLRFGSENVSLPELQKILWAGQTCVVLKDGSLGLLSEDWRSRYAMLVKHAKVHKQQLIVTRWIQLSLQEAGTQVLHGTTTQLSGWWQSWQRWQNDGSLYAIPAGITVQPRPYQQKGYEWMRLMAEAGAGGCLADDMGLGKTLQAICFLTAMTELHPGAQSLVICPASLVYNWEQELKKCAPGLTVSVYHGTRRSDSAIGNPEIQVLITSYGTLRSDIEQMSAVPYLVTFIDESHNIKNPAAKITRAVENIRSKYCFALSGTPVVNNTLDLYSQINTVLPGFLGSREFFKREYADPIDRYGDESKKQSLQQLIAPFILRRTKEQVAADLPSKTEITLWCEMGSAQRLVYETIREQIRSNLFLEIKAKGVAQSRLNVLQGILKLRQICNAPVLVPDAEPPCTDSIKTDTLFTELEQLLPHHKVLVFSQFTGMLNLVAASCDRNKIAYYHFDGQTPAARRMEMVNAFQQEGNTTHLFLISLKAGNAGITLTAADYVFLLDPWWNQAVQQQAIDRTHRIGQTKKVFAYKMICKDTIEEKILQLQERKQKLATDLVASDEGFIKNLEQEDVEWLFG